MSIEARDSGAYAQPNDGPEQLRFPLSDKFQKLESELGFVAPPDAEILLANRLLLPDQDFSAMMRVYVDSYLNSCPAEPDPRSEVYEFRGILANLAHIYYERYMDKREHGKREIHLEHVHREYLRTIEEDIRYLNEPPNETLDSMLVELGVYLPRFPKPKLVRDLFNTNVMHILSKIDTNIAPIWQSIQQSEP